MTLGQNSPGRDLKARLVLLGLAMITGLLLLVVNLYRLQIIHGEEYFAKSQDNFVKEVRIRASRGMILDRKGEILVDERPSHDVFITPAFCDSPNGRPQERRCATEVLPRIAAWLEWDEAQQARVEAQLAATRGPQRFQQMTVAVDITDDQRDVLNAHLTELPGVDVVPVPHRNYRTGPVLAHVLGYMNEVTQEELERLNAQGAKYALGDYIGRRGIERYYESKLRGVDGVSKQVVDARGAPKKWMEQGSVGEPVAPKRGNNVVLSIDARLQAEAERAFPGVAGVVAVVDVRTGFILALVSRPAFDPNVLTGRVSAAQMAALSKDPLQPMVFRAVAQHYSPGSTFKAVTLLAALKSGSFTPQTVVTCHGGYRLGARTWRCWKDSGHGPKNARGALQHSCDTYFYKVADTIGLDPIAEVGRALGFGSPTGIGVVAEVPGIMPDSAYHDRVTPGGYTKGMALNAAIGQGDDNVTPLQLAMAYAAIANGGTLYQPQLVRKVVSPDGTVLEEAQPKVTRTIALSPEHRQVVLDALVAVVNEPGGTAYRSRLKDVVMAGKTGTAQVARLGAVRLKTEQMEFFARDHAWFAAVAPAEDPEIAVVVLNEHGGHGGSDAAPTAAAVVQKYFELKKLDSSASLGPARPPPPPALEPPGPASPPAAPSPPSGKPPRRRDEADRSLATWMER